MLMSGSLLYGYTLYHYDASLIFEKISVICACIALFYKYRFVMIASFFGVVLLFVIDGNGGSWFWLFRTEALAWGILVFVLKQIVWSERIAKRWPLQRTSILIYTIALILFSIGHWLPASAEGLIAHRELIAAGSGLAVFAASLGGFSRGTTIGSRLFFWIGRRSYSVYLIQTIVFHLIDRYIQQQNDMMISGNDYQYVMELVISAAVTMAIADLVHRFIESFVNIFNRKILSGNGDVELARTRSEVDETASVMTRLGYCGSLLTKKIKDAAPIVLGGLVIMSVLFPRIGVLGGLPGTDEGFYAYRSQSIAVSLAHMGKAYRPRALWHFIRPCCLGFSPEIGIQSCFCVSSTCSWPLPVPGCSIAFYPGKAAAKRLGP